MSQRLDKGQIEDLVSYCGSTPTIWRDEDMQICCPVHGETNPSMGVSHDLQICHCFSCGFAGDFASFLYHSLPDEFGWKPDDAKTERVAYARAWNFLADRYELEYRSLDIKRLKRVKRYEDTYNTIDLEEDSRHVLPLYKIATFMSGKETFKYFFDRGFDKSDVRKFKIGRDLENKTVTIPAFYQDGALAGVIGRYISKKRKKNERYKIYDFPRGEILYPMNFYEDDSGVMIIVEGMFDAMFMHKNGYTNVQAIMSDIVTPKQAELISEMCHTVIWLGDGDKRGIEGREKSRKILGDRVKFLEVDYPDVEEYGKDPLEWGIELTEEILKTAHGHLVRKIKRI